MVNVFCINLDSPSVYPGGTVTGHVLLQTEPKERIKARGIRLSLEGREEVHLKRKKKEENDDDVITEAITKATGADELDAERVLIDSRIVLFGGPEGSKGEPVFLEPGRQYSFPFKFHIHDLCLPSCEYDDCKKICYDLECCVDRPWRIDNTCTRKLIVLPNSNVSPAPPNYCTKLEQCMTPTAWCCFSKGCLRLKLTLDKVAYWWKESVPVEVVVDNSHCAAAIKKLKLALRVVSTYRAEGNDDTHKHDVVKHEFPLSGGAIAAHADKIKFRHTLDQSQFKSDTRFPTTTIHGEYILHKFVVRLVVKYGFALDFEDYCMELPIYMADGPKKPVDLKQALEAGRGVALGKPADVDGPVKEPVKDPGYYPSYPSQESGLSFLQTPSGKWPDDIAPIFGRTQSEGDDDDNGSSMFDSDVPMFERTQKKDANKNWRKFGKKNR